jgi:hypothetical protein
LENGLEAENDSVVEGGLELNKVLTYVSQTRLRPSEPAHRLSISFTTLLEIWQMSQVMLTALTVKSPYGAMSAAAWVITLFSPSVAAWHWMNVFAYELSSRVNSSAPILRSGSSFPPVRMIPKRYDNGTE